MVVMRKLLGKRALVTAGAQGIGLAIARQLLEAGCDLFVHYRSSADGARSLEAGAKQLGQRYAHASADLKTTEGCEALVANAVQFLGGIDVLINNAGSLVARKSLVEADDSFWGEVMSSTSAACAASPVPPCLIWLSRPRLPAGPAS